MNSKDHIPLKYLKGILFDRADRRTFEGIDECRLMAFEITKWVGGHEYSYITLEMRHIYKHVILDTPGNLWEHNQLSHVPLSMYLNIINHIDHPSKMPSRNHPYRLVDAGDDNMTMV